MLRLLPWEYGTRNLFRRPLRSGLTLVALTIVILMVMVVVGFVRGLERSLSVSGDPRVAIVFALGMGENLEYSSIPARTSDLIPSSVPGVQKRYGQCYSSPELYLGTQVRRGEDDTPAMGLVRGVTPSALLVHDQVELIEGRWPSLGEVIVGKLAAVKLGMERDSLTVGRTLQFEGREWTISGVFAAGGSAFESELWCRLDELQQSMKRQDLSLVAVKLAPEGDFADVDLFCKERLDLELQSIRQTDYYEGLRKDYAPVRSLGWLMAGLIATAGVFAGLNTMYGSVLGRVRELATLQTLGYQRRALLLSLIQEATILAAAATLAAVALALLLVEGTAVRFTMGAFELRLDAVTLLAGCGTGLMLGVFGTLPPAFRALRMPVVDGLRAV